MFRIYSICSNWHLIHEEIVKLKCVLLKNKYPLGFINSSIKLFLSKLLVHRDKKVTVPKRQFLMCLPFMGRDSLVLKRKLLSFFSTQFPAFQLKIVFKSGPKIGNFLNFKDILPFCVSSFVIYRYSCSHCIMTYIGKTTRHLLIRMSEHLGISHRTRKIRKYNPKQTTAIREHIRICEHSGSFDDFKIASQGKTDFELLIKESLLVGKEQPILNKQIKSFQLALF